MQTMKSMQESNFMIPTTMLTMIIINTQLILTIVLSSLFSQPQTVESARAEQKCFDYPPIGCFTNLYPFNNTAMLPFSPEVIDVHYIYTLHGTSTKFGWQESRIIMRERFKPELDTIMIIHGFMEWAERKWVWDLVTEFSSLAGNRNIIAIDWKGGSQIMSYGQAAANGRVVAAMGALFVKELISMGADPGKIHIIGNSLGAHVAGDLGSQVPGIGRITGLDPARQRMADYPPEVRLDPSDAVFVDVIHTDAKPRIGMGSLIPMGTVDFYPNHGLEQPGCRDSIMEFLLKGGRCSHNRAIYLFQESIKTCTSYAGECSGLHEIKRKNCPGCMTGRNCVIFGYHVDKSISGLYGFSTRRRSPYCLS